MYVVPSHVVLERNEDADGFQPLIDLLSADRAAHDDCLQAMPHNTTVRGDGHRLFYMPS
jgi:hypothetical protein